MLLHATVLVHCMNGAATQGERIPQYPSGLYKMKVKVARSCLTLCNPMDCTVHRILQARILEWVAIPFFRDLPNPGIKPRSFTLQVDSLPAEPPGKPKNIGVGGDNLEWSKRLHFGKNAGETKETQ